MTTLGVGVLGLRHLHPEGYMALFDQVPTMNVVAVAESDDDLRATFSQKHGVPAYADWREVVQRSDVDVVAIFLPHAECPQAVEVAAAAKKHCIVEKPMADSSFGIERMVKACNEHGVVLSTPYLWRYHPVAKEIKRLLNDGAIGDVIALEGRCAAGKPTRYLELSPWILDKTQSGGGAMHNLGVHWIDLFRWLMADEVVSAYGEVRTIFPDISVEDQSFGLITFTNGAKAYLDISYLVPDTYPHGRDLYIGIRGTKGTLAWSPAFEGTSDELFLSSEKKEYADAPLRRFSVDVQPAPGYVGILGVNYLRDLAEVLLQGGAPEIPGSEGAQDLKVVEAIYRSVAEKRPVQL